MHEVLTMSFILTCFATISGTAAEEDVNKQEVRVDNSPCLLLAIAHRKGGGGPQCLAFTVAW
jgi:hypothetical protein